MPFFTLSPLSRTHTHTYIFISFRSYYSAISLAIFLYHFLSFYCWISMACASRTFFTLLFPMNAFANADRIYFRVMGVVLAMKYEKWAISFAFGSGKFVLELNSRSLSHSRSLSPCPCLALKNVDIFLCIFLPHRPPTLVVVVPYTEVTAFVVCNLQPLKTMPTIIFDRKKDEPESVKQELKTEWAENRVERNEQKKRRTHKHTYARWLGRGRNWNESNNLARKGISMAFYVCSI